MRHLLHAVCTQASLFGILDNNRQPVVVERCSLAFQRLCGSEIVEEMEEGPSHAEFRVIPFADTLRYDSFLRGQTWTTTATTTWMKEQNNSEGPDCDSHRQRADACTQLSDVSEILSH